MRLRVFAVSLFTVFLMLVGVGSVSRVQAQSTAFTSASLAQFDGKNGHPAYFAYKGLVYDVSGSSKWVDGDHYGYFAGKDLTGTMDAAPHGEEVLVGLKVVGTYASVAPTAAASAAPTVAPHAVTVPVSQPKAWYESKIRIAGISLLGWTGILLAVFFVLNFATCFALPWSQLPVPWKGSRPGPDPLDMSPAHLHWASIHKYFAWATVVIGIVHGIIGFMQMLGYTL